MNETISKVKPQPDSIGSSANIPMPEPRPVPNSPVPPARIFEPLPERSPFGKAASYLKEAFSTISEPAEKERLVRELLAEVGCSDLLKPFRADAEPETFLPTVAPALWLDREDRQQPPTKFIRDTYRDHLGKGLTRAHIFHLDKPLYNALAKWLRSNKMPREIDLPTKPQQNTRDLQAAADKPAETVDLRDRLRLYHVAKRREQAAKLPKL